MPVAVGKNRRFSECDIGPNYRFPGKEQKEQATEVISRPITHSKKPSLLLGLSNLCKRTTIKSRQPCFSPVRFYYAPSNWSMKAINPYDASSLNHKSRRVTAWGSITTGSAWRV